MSNNVGDNLNQQNLLNYGCIIFSVGEGNSSLTNNIFYKK